METRRHRRGRKKRLLLPLSLLCLVVLLPGALLAPSASASSSSSPAAGGGRKRRWAEFDYYVLALQWPGTICRQTSNCCETNGCCRSKPLKWFTIHGLWPQYNYGGWPSCCRPTRFNINKILMLMPILEKYWPSLYCGSSSTCFGGRGPFWVHEWGMQFSGIVGTQTAAFNYFLISLSSLVMSRYVEDDVVSLKICFLLSTLFSLFLAETHGTCAYPEIQDEYDYFSTALYLYSKYNATKALRKAHIRPASGRKYAVGHIVAVIEYAFGAMPSLVCKNGSVQELRLCFHKDYQPRDCTFETDKAPNSRSQCPRYVTFPSYKPSVLANATEGISDQAIGELHAYG